MLQSDLDCRAFVTYGFLELQTAYRVAHVSVDGILPFPPFLILSLSQAVSHVNRDDCININGTTTTGQMTPNAFTVIQILLRTVQSLCILRY